MEETTVRELTLPFGIDPVSWQGSFNGTECSLHQLAPYVGKLKTGMVQQLINESSDLGQWVLDPFCGAGIVPLQALLQGRKAIGNDLSPYAYAITRGKLSAPGTVAEGIAQARSALAYAVANPTDIQAEAIPEWVRAFFHPETLGETLAVFRACDALDLPFIRACMLGILHHVRPGFLSYPASHMTPYLREKKYPPAEHPEMYSYRAVSTRLLAKVERSYRRPATAAWNTDDWRLLHVNAMELPIADESVDSIVSSPPYFGALDYARDNRLRLWFLGLTDWRNLDKSLTANAQVYIPQMRKCLEEMYRVLKPGHLCVLVLGDVCRDGKTHRTAEMIADESVRITNGGFAIERLVADEIPDDRRSRRRTTTTKVEKILVLKKRLTYNLAARTRGCVTVGRDV